LWDIGCGDGSWLHLFRSAFSKFRNYGSGSLTRDSCLCEEAESGSTLRISGREKHFRSVAYRRLQCCASAFFPAGTDAFELAASVGPDGFVTGVDFDAVAHRLLKLNRS